MGRLDDDGFLYITGRIKEQYKLENGKYVVPAPLEELLQLSGFVTQVFIFGFNKPFNTALVVPDPVELEIPRIQGNWSLCGIPTDSPIGIGAGPHCDGQVLVCYDLLGLTPNLRPKFVKRYAEFFEEGVAAARRYRDEVRAGVFPSEEFSFGNVKKSEAPTPSGLSLVRDVGTAYGPKG